ncbi:hypothetical protein [Bradyrhizobium liaoningense]
MPGDLLVAFAALLKLGKGLVLIDRVELLGCDRRGQRILKGARFVNLAQCAIDRLLGMLAEYHVEGSQAPVAVRDGIEAVAHFLDDEVLDLAARVDVGGEFGNPFVTSDHAGIDAGAVLVAELQAVERNLQVRHRQSPLSVSMR